VQLRPCAATFSPGMKIVHIITRLIIGGAQENTLLSCEGQHDHGHQVTLITGLALGPEGSLMPRAQNYGYRVIALDEMRRSILPWQDYRTYRRMIKLLRELQPDIVHTHSSKAGIIGRWAGHKAGYGAIIHTIHGLSFTASRRAVVNGAYKLLERHAANISDRIVCVADAMRDHSLAAHIGRPEQYVTIYSGMETGPFLQPPVPRQEVRRQLGIADDQVVVGTIARLFELKGHDDLLDLAPDLCKRYPQLRFLWLGDGILRPQLEKRMDDLGLRDRFILTGMVPPTQVPQYTHAMDMLVHPSRREGLARALPQAALAQKPVITYDIDGNKEALLDGQSGFAIPPFDVQKLSQAITVLMDDPARRADMGRRGRELALSRFDSRVMVAALEKLYQTVVAHAS